MQIVLLVLFVCLLVLQQKKLPTDDIIDALRSLLWFRWALQKQQGQWSDWSASPLLFTVKIGYLLTHAKARKPEWLVYSGANSIDDHVSNRVWCIRVVALSANWTHFAFVSTATENWPTYNLNRQSKFDPAWEFCKCHVSWTTLANITSPLSTGIPIQAIY